MMGQDATSYLDVKGMVNIRRRKLKYNVDDMCDDGIEFHTST